jgi:hypothetical protein
MGCPGLMELFQLLDGYPSFMGLFFTPRGGIMGHMKLAQLLSGAHGAIPTTRAGVLVIWGCLNLIRGGLDSIGRSRPLKGCPGFMRLSKS